MSTNKNQFSSLTPQSKKHVPIIYFLSIALLTTLLFGCATKIYRKLPSLKDPNIYSEIIIIRNSSIWGAGGGIGIQIDGYKVASVSVGHRLRMKTDPGQHAVGTLAGSITLNLEASHTYYFLSGIGFSGDQNIERIDDLAAKKWLTNSTEVLLK